MLGGQLTTQLAPPDEHYWIEDRAGGFGSSASYRQLRERVRDSYRKYRPVTEAFKKSNEAYPGDSWVSRLTAEPLVWRNRIMDMLRPYIELGRLTVLYHCWPESAAVSGSRITKVAVRHANGDKTVIKARMFIDATELGDVLPVVGATFTIGREANNVSGRVELHNEHSYANQLDQQAITWSAAVGYRPGGDYRSRAPAGYAKHKAAFDEFFAANLFDPTRDYAWDQGPNFWQYRRVIARSQFTVPIEEVTLLNYPCNDYTAGPVLGVSAAERLEHLVAARNLTACLVHYLQNDIPRADGTGTGYRGLRLRPDITGTQDGFAAAPYIREARRLVSIGRVREWHVGVDARRALGSNRAATFADAVGTGHYWLDVHAGPADRKGVWKECYPYQIPFMALIPTNRSNLLAGGKCVGVSHVVNGAFRLHPTEWAVGEAAGIAAHCAFIGTWRPPRFAPTDSGCTPCRSG